MKKEILKVQIQRINNYQSNFNVQNFKAGPIETAGMLKSSTVRDVETIMFAYRDIVTKLSRKTEEGIKKIQEKFPNVSIGEGVTFHNCGAYGTSILIRSAESKKYHNLTRIIERKSRSINYGTKIVINSFILDGNERLLENKDENIAKSYPAERLYLTSEEIEKDNLEVRLKGVLATLDSAMLQFRKYLLLNQNEDLRLPDGHIPSTIADDIKKIENLHKDIDLKLDTLPTKVALKLRKSYYGYRLQTGLKTHSFSNPDGSYIVYTPVESDCEYELKRFVMYDKDGKVLKLFMTADSSKLVSNLSKEYPTYIPNTFKYVDESQIQQQEYIPNFQKLVEMYKFKLIGLQRVVDNYIDECNRIGTKAALPNEVEAALVSIQNNYEKISDLLKEVPIHEGTAIKKSFSEYMPSSKGLTLVNHEDGSRVQILPINSQKHSDLTRLTVKKDENTEWVYLLKDNKYIISNYNPKYPLIFPNILKYATASELEMALKEVMPYISYLENKAEAYKNHIAQKVQMSKDRKEAKEGATTQKKYSKSNIVEKNVPENVEMNGVTKRAKKASTAQKEYSESQKDARKELINECKNMISNAIDAGNPENLSVVLDNIKTKIYEYFTHISEHQ